MLSETLSETLKSERNQKKRGKREGRRARRGSPAKEKGAGALLRIPRPGWLSRGACYLERGCSYVEAKSRSIKGPSPIASP